MRWRRPNPWFAFFVLCLACEQPDDATTPFTSRDSAGVIIAENFEPAWQRGDVWRVAGILVDINASSGTEYDLSDARSSVLLPGGTIVVANTGTKEIRWYDLDGVYLQTSAQRANWIGRFGQDSVAAWDSMQNTMSIYSNRGDFARSFRIELPESDRPSTVSTFRDRTMLVSGATDNDTAIRYRVSSDGELQNSLGVFAGVVAPGLAGFYARTQQDLDLAFVHVSGALRALVRHASEQQPTPRIGAMLTDLEDNLWVEDYPDTDGVPQWKVFDDSHRLLGTVLIPRNFTPHQIGNSVLGRFVDTEGVEHIRLYALLKPS